MQVLDRVLKPADPLPAEDEDLAIALSNKPIHTRLWWELILNIRKLWNEIPIHEVKVLADTDYLKLKL